MLDVENRKAFLEIPGKAHSRRVLHEKSFQYGDADSFGASLRCRYRDPHVFSLEDRFGARFLYAGKPRGPVHGHVHFRAGGSVRLPGDDGGLFPGRLPHCGGPAGSEPDRLCDCLLYTSKAVT